MIQYYKSAYGVGLLLRISGSAVYRSVIPGLVSVGFTVLFRRYRYRDYVDDSDIEYLNHPYAIGVLVATLTFLLVFRVQQGYARYWEAASATHHFLSKWMDAVIHTAAFHMQCSHYDHIKPPSFYDHPELNAMYLTRARERYATNTSPTSSPPVSESQRIHDRAIPKSIEHVSFTAARRVGSNSSRTPFFFGSNNKPPASAASGRNNNAVPGIPPPSPLGRSVGSKMHSDTIGSPIPLEGRVRLDGNWGALFDDGKATFFDPKNPERNDPCGFAGIHGGRTPPLFLQELAHLASLLSAVALSTLRNDVEGAESPLDIYEPGSPWPAVDPWYKSKKRKDNGKHGRAVRFSLWQRIKFFLGASRSPEDRTRYNASRPMPVIGGVSAGEIRFLQLARGPYAKTQLCWYWISEFITREHLAGSLGKVGPPIVSRIIQFLGDGMIYYNHARKIMFIPFPFPHAQLSVVYVLVAIPAVAALSNQYANNLWLACLLSFLTVTCLSGIHEVARELENPFRQVPNELPLVTFQAQFNEALIIMYSGYNPDHFWEEEANEASSSSMPTVDEIPIPASMDEKQKQPHPDIPVKTESDSRESDIQSLVEHMKREMEEQRAEMERQKQEIERLQIELKQQSQASVKTGNTAAKTS